MSRSRVPTSGTPLTRLLRRGWVEVSGRGNQKRGRCIPRKAVVMWFGQIPVLFSFFFSFQRWRFMPMFSVRISFILFYCPWRWGQGYTRSHNISIETVHRLWDPYIRIFDPWYVESLSLYIEIVIQDFIVYPLFISQVGYISDHVIVVVLFFCCFLYWIQEKFISDILVLQHSSSIDEFKINGVLHIDAIQQGNVRVKSLLWVLGERSYFSWVSWWD
jgi:hypothetical protein